MIRLIRIKCRTPAFCHSAIIPHPLHSQTLLAQSPITENPSARAPGDARPRPGAAAITTVSVPIGVLPLGVLQASAGSTELRDLSTFDMTKVISETYRAPTAIRTLAITGLSAPLQAGVAYTIVLGVNGVGSLSLVAAHPAIAGSRNDFAMRDNALLPFLPIQYVVPFTLGGERSLSATSESAVVRQVRISIDTSSGDTHVSSAGVYSQVMAEDPWLGVVPDETP